MKNEAKGGIPVDDLFNEFDFVVPGMEPIETDDVQAATAAADVVVEEDVQTTTATTEVDDTEVEEKQTAPKADVEEEEEQPTPAPTGKSGGFYKDLAKKYVENGRWGADLAIEDEEGNQIPIEDIEDLNEETFFEIEKAIQAADAADLKEKYIPIADLDERKKNLVTIITEGGDLASIFKSEQQVEEYLNPFGKMDLDDERVQERVYLNALINYNNLDAEAAQAVVDKAKKELTLDTKVKTFVDGYTKNFDKYVEDQKNKLIEDKATKKKELLEFKKSLTEQYKGYELKDTLIRKLTDSVVKESEEGYVIDSIYDQKMKDPAEAAELILFLNDKEAYLAAKLKDSKIQDQKNTRRLIKVIPKAKGAGIKKEEESPEAINEFDFIVPINK